MPDVLPMPPDLKMLVPAATRYTLTAQALHWLTVLLVLAVLPVAWVVVSLPQSAERSWLFVVHRSLGITILAVVTVRLAWRAMTPPPPSPGGSVPVLEFAGRLTHWLLYGLLVLMPVTGYLQSASGRAVSYFGLLDLPALPQNKALDEVCKTLHLASQWGLYALVALHVLATAWHVAIRRDGLLSRMIPPQGNDECGP